MTIYESGRNITTNEENKKASIKLRIRKKSKIIDKKLIVNGVAASANHADDGAILARAVEILAEFNIPIITIHDSIGSNIGLSSIIKIAFKIATIEYIESLIAKDIFPFDKLNNAMDNIKDELIRREFVRKRTINKEIFSQNKNQIYQEIINSIDFFN
jgi:hypothetical protein